MPHLPTPPHPDFNSIVTRMSRDVAAAASTLTIPEVRYLVETYYRMQSMRIISGNQTRALTKDGEPTLALSWLEEQYQTLEGQIKRGLDKYSAAHPVGEWARSQVGIGPVIAAAFLAYIDLARAPTVGHIWRYAGLDPTVRWKKGEKRPWNAELKVVCWKLGESFVKNAGREGCYYGKVYQDRKEWEQARNYAGEYEPEAARILAEKNFTRDTDARAFYTSGMLPPGHIHARAKRYAVKLFLSHYHTVAHIHAFGRMPAAPFAIGILGHAHYDPPPGLDAWLKGALPTPSGEDGEAGEAGED